MSTRTGTWIDKDFAEKLHRLAFLSKKAMVSRSVGDHRSAHKGLSLEFDDYRKYVPGDDLRRIDWNIYARLERLFVKMTEAQEGLTLHLLIDASQSMDWGEPNKMHYAKRAAAALGYVALHHSDWVTATSFGQGLQDRFPAVRGQAQLPPLFNFLDRVKAHGETNLHESLRTYRRQSKGLRGIVVLISDLLSPNNLASGLPYLTDGSTEVVVVHLLDPSERDPRLQGDLRLQDVETEDGVEITITPAVLAHYRKRFESWCGELEAVCQGRNARYIRILTDWPLENLILSYLRRRRILR